MTHLPNGLALKMDGAQACFRCPPLWEGRASEGVGGRGDCGQVCPVRGDEVVSSADLGGSSKYSKENFED
jgi:hypothetical protein